EIRDTPGWLHRPKRPWKPIAPRLSAPDLRGATFKSGPRSIGSTAILGQPFQQIDDRIVHPRVREEVAMPNVATGNDRHASNGQPMIDFGTDVDVMGSENVFQLGVLRSRRAEIDADKKRCRMLLYP